MTTVPLPSNREIERRRVVIEERHPEAGFLGEETGEARRGDGLRFIVDPIDGTRASYART